MLGSYGRLPYFNLTREPAELSTILLPLEGTGGRVLEADREHAPGRARLCRPVSPGATDAVNAALNYGYGILTAHVWGAVMNAGLEPFAGFLHVDRSGKPSLVLDLMEEFRQPVVDRPIFSWLNKGGQLMLQKGMLDAASKENVASRVLMRLVAEEQHRGKQHQVRSIIQMQARLAASAVRGSRPYRSSSFKW